MLLEAPAHCDRIAKFPFRHLSSLARFADAYARDVSLEDQGDGWDLHVHPLILATNRFFLSQFLNVVAPFLLSMRSNLMIGLFVFSHFLIHVTNSMITNSAMRN